jgi:hypothetical protein
MKLSILVAKNFIDSYGPVQFLLKILLLDFIHYFTLCYLFEPGAASIAALFYEKHTFFIALACFSSATLSWEKDVFCGLGKAYVLSSPWTIVTSRLLTCLCICGPFLAFLFVTIVRQSTQVGLECLNAFVLAVAATGLGISLGFAYGFNREKSINNMVHVSVWILALGSSFSRYNNSQLFNSVLPSNLSLSSPGTEFFKSLIWLFVSYLLLKKGFQPKSRMF